MKDDATKITATFQRPTLVTLKVESATGELWNATEDDLRKMGFVLVEGLVERLNRFLAQLSAYHSGEYVERDDLSRGGTPYLNLIRVLFEDVASGLYTDERMLAGEDWACLKYLVALDTAYRSGDESYDLTVVER